MLEYILVPYMVKTRERLKLADDHPILAIFNVFQAHRYDSVLGELHHHHIHQVFIPARCTGKLQPLHVSVNEEFKAAMKANFSHWYANEVKEALDQATKVDLKAIVTVVKPLHANWLVMSISPLKSKSDIIQRGFEKSGILKYKYNQLTLHYFLLVVFVLCITHAQ